MIESVRTPTAVVLQGRYIIGRPTDARTNLTPRPFGELTAVPPLRWRRGGGSERSDEPGVRLPQARTQATKRPWAIVATGLVLVSLLSGSVGAEPLRLVYRPTPGIGSTFTLELSALFDSPIGTGVPITGRVAFSMVPTRATSDGRPAEVLVSLHEGEFQVMGQKWDFHEKALTWTWLIDSRRKIVGGAESLNSLLAIVELLFRFVFAADLPEGPVDVGSTWESHASRPVADGGSAGLLASHTLTGLGGEPRAAGIASAIEMPVHADLFGASFEGAFGGRADTSIRAEDGEVLSVSAAGSAELSDRKSALDVGFRDLHLVLVRTGDYSGATALGSGEEREREREVSDNPLVDAVLNAEVTKYLKDTWQVYYPRLGSTARDGNRVGAGVVGRFHGLLYGFDGYYGTQSERLVYRLSVTRGLPIQPRSQQTLELSNDDGRTNAKLSAKWYSGRRLGLLGTGRMRYSADLALSGVKPNPPWLRTDGDAHYVKLSAARSKGGRSLVGYRHLDWSTILDLHFGGGLLGGDYDYFQARLFTRGFWYFHADHTLATRLTLDWTEGNAPDQYRTYLIDHGCLRGFGLSSAPLVGKALTGSMEYRFRSHTPRFLDRIGLRDWWGALFVDAGIGGNTAQDLLNSRVYVDAGYVWKGRIKYFGVPVYINATFAWPLTPRPSASPRLRLGLDWDF